MGWGEPRSKEKQASVLSSDERGLIQSCEIWGVLNVTPDSFSDGGRFLAADSAVQHARTMLAEGADVIDVGGESSRPRGPVYDNGADRVSADEEIRRVVPVIRAVTQTLGARVSVDTVKAEVAKRAIEAGASFVNDVSCGASYDLLNVVAETKVHILLMHTRGRGEIVEKNVNYQDVVKEVIIELMKAVDRSIEAGIDPKRIWIDPGIGFAKTPEQSVRLLACTADLVATGYPVLVGPSRKSFIAQVAPNHTGEKPKPNERFGGTAAAVTAAVLGGARAVRVHDVQTMRQVVLVAESMRSAASPSTQHNDSGRNNP